MPPTACGKLKNGNKNAINYICSIIQSQKRELLL
jgi:hypothetical protein